MSQENPNLILIKAITGTYINLKLPQRYRPFDQVVDNILAILKMPVSTGDVGSEAEIAAALRLTLDWLKKMTNGDGLTLVDLCERIKLNCYFTTDYVESIRNLLTGIDTLEPHVVASRVETLCKEMEHSYFRMRIGERVSKLNKQINFSKDFIDIVATVQEAFDELKVVENNTGKLRDNFGGKVDFSDPESIAETLKKAQESESAEGVLKTGLQGINDALGINGYRRGGSYNYGALTHNYKTGILLDHCRWLPIYNKPFMWDANKRPMILRVSFENKVEQDVPLIFKSLWEAEHKQKIDLKDVNIVEAAKYIQERMAVNGYHFEMLCYDPNNMSVWDLITIIDGYIAEGYEIHAVIIDYLELITKTGSAGTRADERIVHAFETLRNHCFPKGVTQINAHQLSTEAQQLSREGTSNFAVKVSTGGWYMNCKSLHTKLDGEFLMHIHTIGDEKYLTFAKGKDRTDNGKVPVRRRSFAYKFEYYGGINDDFHEEKSKAIYEWSQVAQSTDPTEILQDQNTEEDDWLSAA